MLRVFGDCAMVLFCALVVLACFPVVHYGLKLMGKRSRVVRGFLRWYISELHVDGTTDRSETLVVQPDPETPESRDCRQTLLSCDGNCTFLKVMGGCACFWLFLFAVLVGALSVVGWLQVSRAYTNDTWHDPSITPPLFPRYMGCGNCKPGNKSDEEIQACVEPCFSLDFVKAWERFATEQPWSLVYFPSRSGPNGESSVNISAWWLPADPKRVPKGKVAPRIVVQHGMASNANHCGVQAACFLLRTMGFSCLTPTVRDYGLSNKSTHPTVTTWGYDYHLDLLGAWDYAVSDPEQILGGRLDDDQVGIMGFSRGGLDAANAFGLEHRVRAAWIDSAPFTGLYGMIDAFVRPYAGGVLTPLVTGIVWKYAHLFSGGKVDTSLPLNSLTKCSEPARRLAVSQDMEDEFVPITEGLEAIRFLSGLNTCYTISVYNPPADCNGDRHHSYMWVFPDDARAKLCEFWSEAFGQDPHNCGLDKMQKFQRVKATDEVPVPPWYAHIP